MADQNCSESFDALLSSSIPTHSYRVSGHDVDRRVGTEIMRNSEFSLRQDDSYILELHVQAAYSSAVERHYVPYSVARCD